MTKAKRQLRVNAFKKDILKVCEQYGLTFVPCRVDYDEYDSDEGLEVEPGNPYLIRDARMSDFGAGYMWRGLK